MAARERTDPAKTRQVVVALADWLHDETRPAPDRDALASAVKLANEFKLAIVVVDPDNGWKKEWGDLYRCPRPAFCGSAMRFRAEAHPGHTAECRRDRSADLVTAGYRAGAVR